MKVPKTMYKVYMTHIYVSSKINDRKLGELKTNLAHICFISNYHTITYTIYIYKKKPLIIISHYLLL